MQGSLAERLRLLRAQRGLTLVQAAQKIGIGRDTISDLERGRRHPVTPTLAKIAKGYEVPVEELLEEPTGLKAQWVAEEAQPSPGSLASLESDEERRAQDIFQRFPDEEERLKHMGVEFALANHQHSSLFYRMLSAAKEFDDTSGVDVLLNFFVIEGFPRFLSERGVIAYINAVLERRVETSPKERQFCEGLRKMISAQVGALSRMAEDAWKPARDQHGAA
jgi:transcriptional regulator with XRE-family HTH domain